MSRRWVPCLSLLLVSVHLAAAQPEARFLSFSVQQKNGIHVRDLKAGEVQLFLDDQPVDLRYFGYRDVDTSVVVLIENSPRTARFNHSRAELGRINTVDVVRHHLMEEVIPAIAELGEVWIGQFYKELETVSEFTDQSFELLDAVQRMEPRPQHLETENIPVSRMLGRGIDVLRNRTAKRKILLLFAATADLESIRNLDEYRELLRRSDVDLYVVSFGPRQNSVSSHATMAQRANPFYFEKLVSETAGKFYLSGEFVFPREFMNDLMSTLSNTYTLGFYVEPDGSRAERTVRLQVDRRKCRVSHRKILVF